MEVKVPAAVGERRIGIERRRDRDRASRESRVHEKRNLDFVFLGCRL
jgi:hypothetical protein